MHQVTRSLLPFTLLLGLPAQAALPPDVGDQVELVPPDGQSDDAFGAAVDISGDTLVIGAPALDFQEDRPGKAYVYVRAAGSWTLQATLEPSDGHPANFFGEAVGVDGDTIAVGAKWDGEAGALAGAIYIFERTGTDWTEVAKRIPDEVGGGDWFGGALGVSGDTVVAAGRGESSEAYVYRRGASTWVLEERVIASDPPVDGFVRRLAVDGDTVVVGTPWDPAEGFSAGSGFVYERTGATWDQSAKLTASDAFPKDLLGWSADVHGDTIVLGAVGESNDAGAAYVFVRDGNGWTEEQKLVPFDPGNDGDFGYSVAVHDEFIAVGARVGTSLSDSGAVYLYARNDGEWSLQDRIVAHDGSPTDTFGYDVALDPSTLVSGARWADGAAPFSGTTYVVEYAGYAVAYCFCGEGASPCANEDEHGGCANSTGAGAQLTPTGTASVSADDLVLGVTGVPADQFGIVYMGAGQIELPFGDGERCVDWGAVGLFRYDIQNSGPGGTLSEGPGIGAFAQANFGVAGQITAGQTWNFQAWYRDPAPPCGSGFNLSNALSVTFQP